MIFDNLFIFEFDIIDLGTLIILLIFFKIHLHFEVPTYVFFSLF